MLQVLSKVASSTIFWVFGMTQPGIGPRSPELLASTLTIMPMSGNNIQILYLPQDLYMYIYKDLVVDTEFE